MGFTQAWDNEGLYKRYYGILTSKDIIESNSKMFGNSNFDNIKYKIVDFTDVTDIEVDDNDAKVTAEFTARSSQINKNIKIALISNNDKLISLIEKYIKATLTQFPNAQQQIFNDINEARSWTSS